jgi:hypothetical protein
MVKKRFQVKVSFQPSKMNDCSDSAYYGTAQAANLIAIESVFEFLSIF